MKRDVSTVRRDDEIAEPTGRLRPRLREDLELRRSGAAVGHDDAFAGVVQTVVEGEAAEMGDVAPISAHHHVVPIEVGRRDCLRLGGESIAHPDEFGLAEIAMVESDETAIEGDARRRRRPGLGRRDDRHQLGRRCRGGGGTAVDDHDRRD